MATKTAPRADLIEKAPTALQANFIRYMKAQTGYDIDETTVVLFQALRTPFQKSDENRADLERRRVAASEKAAEPKVERAPRVAKKAPAKKVAPVVKAAPVKRVAKKAPAKKAPRALAVVGESPFDEE